VGNFGWRGASGGQSLGKSGRRGAWVSKTVHKVGERGGSVSKTAHKVGERGGSVNKTAPRRSAISAMAESAVCAQVSCASLRERGERRAYNGSVKAALRSADFVRAPVGRYIAGRTWLLFCADQELSGAIAWGRPAGTDARNWTAAARGLRGMPHARYLDVRRIEALSDRAFDTLAEHITTVRAETTRAALVHSGGLIGAAAAGFGSVRALPDQVEFFTEPFDALTWLGRNDAAELARELDQLQANAAGSSPIVRDLRAILGTHQDGTDLGTVASALGLSERSLQRRLTAEGTSLQNEVKLARVRAAQRLLLETEANISEIALEVGCASSQHFASIFRDVTGTSPKQWRMDNKRRR
jgi:AraC-like DNA-binding protein